MDNKEFKTIKYYKAKQLASITINKSDEAKQVLEESLPEDNVAVLLSITNLLKIEKVANLTKGGFNKVKDLIPI